MKLQQRFQDIHTQRIAEYQEQPFKLKEILLLSIIEAQKQVISSFQSQQGDRNSSSNNNGVLDWFNLLRIAENHAVMVNNFTSDC